MKLILPKISIIIPSFNQLTFLEKAVKSVEDQEYPSLELIVVDGGSEDGTKEFLEIKKNVVTKWISERDNGQTEALNKGFRMATGEIFGWLNCDERYLPGSLLKIGNLFSANLDLDIVFGNRIVVDVSGGRIKEMKLPNISPYKYILYAGGILYSDTTFWKADLHIKTGELDEIFCRRYCMDYDWFGRMSLNVKKWRYLDEFISEFMEHDGRVSLGVREISSISSEIRLKLMKQAKIPKIKILLLSPYYLGITRFKRLGMKEYFCLPSLKSILRVAGFIR